MSDRIYRDEADIKNSFMNQVRHEKDSLYIRHEDKGRSGIPDVSLTMAGFTSWWEFKHATPHYQVQGIQELTCRKLDKFGLCRFVVFEDYANSKGEAHLVHIVKPSSIRAAIEVSSLIETSEFFSSFGYSKEGLQSLARWIEQRHMNHFNEIVIRRMS
jgi:hypothetical protein